MARVLAGAGARGRAARRAGRDRRRLHASRARCSSSARCCASACRPASSSPCSTSSTPGAAASTSRRSRRRSACPWWAWSATAASASTRLRRLIGRPESWSRPVLPPPADAVARAGWADSVTARALQSAPRPDGRTARIDRVVLHPLLGTLLFAAVMVLFFQLIFAWAEPAMNAIDAAVGAAQGAVRSAAAAGAAGRLPRRRPARRRRLGDRLPAPDPDPLLGALPARGPRLHGARGLRGGPRDGAHRARGPRLRRAALLLRLRGARHHGDAHDSLAAQPARHDPRRAADDLLGAAAGLRAADRRLRAGAHGVGPDRPPGPGAARPVPARRAALRSSPRRC